MVKATHVLTDEDISDRQEQLAEEGYFGARDLPVARPTLGGLDWPYTLFDLHPHELEGHSMSIVTPTPQTLLASAQTSIHHAEPYMHNAGGLRSLENADSDITEALALINSATTPTTPTPAGIPGAWKLVFEDTFRGTALDSTKWSDHNGWKNQNNVTDNSANVIVNDGLALVLASNGSGAAIESAYGLPVGAVAEAEIMFMGNGAAIYNWPAWWMSGPSWPAAGENDIAEGLGDLTVNYHSPSGAYNQGVVPGVWSNAFHTYGIHRGASACQVYWDGQLVKQYATDDDGAGETLILTMGQANDVVFGAASTMHARYVRAWVPA